MIAPCNGSSNRGPVRLVPGPPRPVPKWPSRRTSQGGSRIAGPAWISPTAGVFGRRILSQKMGTNCPVLMARVDLLPVQKQSLAWWMTAGCGAVPRQFQRLRRGDRGDLRSHWVVAGLDASPRTLDPALPAPCVDPTSCSATTTGHACSARRWSMPKPRCAGPKVKTTQIKRPPCRGPFLSLQADLTPKKNEVPLHLRYPVAKGVSARKPTDNCQRSHAGMRRKDKVLQCKWRVAQESAAPAWTR